MKDPETYVASMASIETRSALPPAVTTPRIEGDPLNAFEHFHFKIQADLRGWMTHDEASREANVKDFSRVSDRQAETLKLTPERIHKILNYIIYIESHHPLGSRNVAAVAFNALFPREEKK